MANRHYGNSIEATAEFLGQNSERDAGDSVVARPIWDGEPGDPDWHAAAEQWTHDRDGKPEWIGSPVETEVERADAEASIMRDLTDAIRTRTRDRYPAISRVLDEASETCSPDFAERLVDAVNAAFPDYRAYCMRTVAGYHRRGRKPQHERQAGQEAA